MATKRKEDRIADKVVKDIDRKDRKRDRRQAKTKDIKRAMQSVAVTRQQGREGSSLARATDSDYKKLAKYGKASWIEKRNYQYVLGLMNPSLPDMPGPLHGRNPGMKTQFYQIEDVQQMQANAAGYAFCGITLDSWTKDPTSTSTPYAREAGSFFMSTAGNGTPLMATLATYAPTTFPAIGAPPVGCGVYVLGGAGGTFNTIAPGASGYTQYRLVSCAMHIAPDMTSLNNSGTLLVGQNTNIDYINPGLSVVNGQGYGALADVPASYQLTQTFDVPEWVHGKEAVVSAIPTGNCYGQFYGPNGAAITAQVGRANLWAIAKDCVPNSFFRVRAVYNYEITTIPSFLASTLRAAERPEDIPVSGPTPSAQVLQAYGGTPSVRPEGKAVAKPAMAAALHEKAMNTPMSKAESKSWLSDAASGVETGIEVVGGIMSAVELVGSLLG